MLNYVLALIIAAETSGVHDDVGIRQLALDDVNKFHNTSYTLEDTRDREIALFVMRSYLNLWCNKERLGREPDVLDYMATYRAGPKGWQNKYDWWHYYEQGKRNLGAINE